MSICEVNGLTPLKNIGSIQGSYDNQFKRDFKTNGYINKRQKIHTEELKKQKDVNVENDFFRLMQIKEKEINSNDIFNNKGDLIVKINTYYNHQRNLLDKYSKLISDNDNKIVSLLINHNDLNDDGAISLEEAGKTIDKIFKADANGDGLVVEEELVASVEKVLLSDQKKIVATLSEKLNGSYEVHRTKESQTLNSNP